MTAGKLGRCLVPLAAALALAWPASSSASQSTDVFCDYIDAGEPGPPGNVLAVTAVESDDLELEVVPVPRVQASPRDGRITVHAGDGALACAGGQPTVDNVDAVRLVAAGYASILLDVGEAPFAPGVTDEGDRSPEIEVSFVSSDGYLLIGGGPGPNRMVAAPKGNEGALGVNLNPRRDGRRDDFDVTLTRGGKLGLLGAGGADRIRMAGSGDELLDPFGRVYMVGGGGADTLVSDGAGFTIGGAGNDLLRGGDGFNFFFGQGGRDTLLGGGDRDYLEGGPGADDLRSGAQRDYVVARDRDRDRIDCGPGRDQLASYDLFDGHRSCERRDRGKPGESSLNSVVVSKAGSARFQPERWVPHLPR